MSEYLVNQHAKFEFDSQTNAQYVKFTDPAGRNTYVPTFKNCEFKFYRDDYGYIIPVEAAREAYLEARFTPTMPGVYKYSLCLEDESEVLSGCFEAVHKKTGDVSGYVEISKNDSRYFAYDDGSCFVPIGVALTDPEMHEAPKGKGYFKKDGKEYRGIITREYRRIIKRMSENGANLLKIRVSDNVFDARTEFPECYNYAAFALLDKVIEECRSYGIKILLTFDCFRRYNHDGKAGLCMRYRKTGREVMDVTDYMRTTEFCEEWLRDLKGYIYRYGNDPVIFAFELFDEMDRIEGLSMEDIENFTNYVIPHISRSMPRTMIINSLSRCDAEYKKENEARMAKTEVSFDQIHRCFDLSAQLPECKGAIHDMARTAVEDMRNKRKPFLVTATGAVNDSSDDAFLYYRNDYPGLIFYDTVYTPFFAGAAGTGIIMHTAEYIDSHNLWGHYKVFSDMVNSLKVDKQHFKFEFCQRRHYWMMLMHGRTTTLAYIRANRSNWEYALRDDKKCVLFKGFRIQSQGGKRAKIFALPGENMPDTLSLRNGEFWLPNFRHGLFLRIR